MSYRPVLPLGSGGACVEEAGEILNKHRVAGNVLAAPSISASYIPNFHSIRALFLLSSTLSNKTFFVNKFFI
jgi:hypothetical protein